MQTLHVDNSTNSIKDLNHIILLIPSYYFLTVGESILFEDVSNYLLI